MFLLIIIFILNYQYSCCPKMPGLFLRNVILGYISKDPLSHLYLTY
ncbi:hypothetical protein SAMN05660293_04775 [Dyadobacter psychrophilus]|uniref:Uncharacterized protein n=1 Tax=Dyadobacter psychrophilus TaxID=651661 RepID=A0A1T5H361_9BACT|nr:hypothetical protein SAMN05660293_04775 [Dyadobacter psychrophilus]